MWKKIGIVLPLILTAIVVWSFFSPGCRVPFASQNSSEELRLVEEAWQAIVNDYVDSGNLSLKDLSQAAIRGMIDSLDDPYSAYFDPQDYKFSQQSLTGSFGGIGAEVTVNEEGDIKIVAPIIGTPAHKAGIQPGDRILEIEGESTQGMSMIQAVLRIRGEPGSTVSIKILHEGDSAPEEMVITREEIKLSSVHSTMLRDDIAQVKVYYFSSRTGSEFVSALNDILASNAKGIILDLRDNPGGVLTEAVKMVSQFVADGIVVYTIDGESNKQVWEVEEGEQVTDLPLVILVNENSASASEVVAGALQDHERAIVIGTTTLGKGTVNHFRELSDGSAMYITIARWYTPNGRQIEGQGIAPDIVVDNSPADIEEGRDAQLEQALEYIQTRL